MSSLLLALALVRPPFPLLHDLPRPPVGALAVAGVSEQYWNIYEPADAKILLKYGEELNAASGDQAARLQALKALLEDLPPGEVRVMVIGAAAVAAAKVGDHAAAARYYAEEGKLSIGGGRREAFLRQAEQALLADEPAFALEGLRDLDRVEPTVPFDGSVGTPQFARRVLLYVRAGDPVRAIERYVQSAPDPADDAAVRRYGDFASALAEALPPDLKLPFWKQAVRRMGDNAPAYPVERLRRAAAAAGDETLAERLAAVGIRFHPDAPQAAAQLQALRSAAADRGRAERVRQLDRLILDHPHTDLSDRWDAAVRLGVTPPVDGPAATGPLVPEPDPLFAAPDPAAPDAD